MSLKYFLYLSISIHLTLGASILNSTQLNDVKSARWGIYDDQYEYQQIDENSYQNVFMPAPCVSESNHNAYMCPCGSTSNGGQCGSFGGESACKCQTPTQPLDSIGQVCTMENINSGKYLYPYQPDPKKYIQCDHQPGIYFIRDCGPGTVFDARFSVCNYPLPVDNQKPGYSNTADLGQCCTWENINKGQYLFPHPTEPTKYIQCDHAPGLYFIRPCGPGTVFDARFSICNYPSGTHG